MTKIAHILVALMILGLAIKSHGQTMPDPHFSQFYANRMYLNPALAGSQICPRLDLSYRNQWPSLPDNFTTFNASFDMYIPKIHGGVGIYILGDNAGDLLNTSVISAMYSYRLKISNWTTINFALEASYIQTKLNWENLVFGDMIDPNLGIVNATSEIPPSSTSIAYPDFDFGVAFSHKGNIYGGIAVHHLTEPSNSFYDVSSSKLQMRYTVHGGTFIDLTGSYIDDENYGSFAISPNFLYMQQGDFHQLNIGMYVNKRPFIVGAWFRHNFENVDAIVPMVGLEWKGLKVAYSYDITLSQLKGATGGAHEVSVGYQFNCLNQKRRRERAISCPSF
ncbi:MAG: type IX secretion system membrane protein PorP/SprF [Bacteroidota bacterium]